VSSNLEKTYSALNHLYRWASGLALRVRPRFLVGFLGTIAVGLTALSLIGQYEYFVQGVTNENAVFYRIFNLDGERRTPTTFSALLLLGNAAMLLAIAANRARRAGKHVVLWFLLSGIFVYLAIDERVGIHEEALDFLIPLLGLENFVIRWLGIEFLHFWVVPGSFIMLVLLGVYWRFLRDLPLRTRRLVLLSAAIYLGGALGIETIGGLYAVQFGKDNLEYQLIANVEELAEMLGMVVFAGTLLRYWHELLRAEAQPRLATRPGSLPKSAKPTDPRAQPATVDRRRAGYQATVRGRRASDRYPVL
jgi:hypothetical protein